MHDVFGDRIKAYEATETTRRLDPSLPICVRIDGRSFSRFTRGLERPFDLRLTRAMISTAGRLLEESHARIAFVQSDEISLVLATRGESDDETVLFDAKVHKLTSVLAGLATAAFIQSLEENGLGDMRSRLPHFDARAFNVPSREEATNVLLWRALDASKNAVQMVARSYFSHETLQNRSTSDLLAMLEAHGVSMDALPGAFRFGTFLKREVVEKTLEDAEYAAIPEPHRPPREKLFMRTRIAAIEDLWQRPFMHATNRADIVFSGAAPLYRDCA